MVTKLRIAYEDGRALLRAILLVCTELRFAIDHVDIEQDSVGRSPQEESKDLLAFEGIGAEGPQKRTVVLSMEVKGRRPISDLFAKLAAIDGVIGVGSLDDADELE
jgi:putative Mg2+ transporter-C (MgtC) family protein